MVRCLELVEGECFDLSLHTRQNRKSDTFINLSPASAGPATQGRSPHVEQQVRHLNIGICRCTDERHSTISRYRGEDGGDVPSVGSGTYDELCTSNILVTSAEGANVGYNVWV